MKEIKIQMRHVDALSPYARNARTHSDAQVEQIANSITEFGWTNPILVDAEGTIIAGHGRLMAAKKLRMDKVPVIELDGLTEAQQRALVIADNQLALNAGWDEEVLKLELHALAELDYNLELTGFDGEELSKLMFDDPKSDDSDADDGPVNFNVQFNIVFDDEPQQEKWFSFVRFLKTAYPDAGTLGERLQRFIDENSYVAD